MVPGPSVSASQRPGSDPPGADAATCRPSGEKRAVRKNWPDRPRSVAAPRRSSRTTRYLYGGVVPPVRYARWPPEENAYWAASVDDAVSVRVVERVGDLACNANRFVYAELRFPVELIAQRFAFDVRHHVVQEPVGRAGIEERQDVRVLETGGGLDLLDEAVATEDGGQLGLEDLDRDLAVVLQVFGEVDRGHAARADLMLDAVAVLEGAGDAVGDVSHALPGPHVVVFPSP